MTIDFKRVSGQGTNFYLASQRCGEKRQIALNEVEWLMIPQNVCLGFSIELNIKALILCENNELPNIHNLEKLLKRLNGKTQNGIISDTGFDKESFWSSLKDIANSFEDWRYIYEQNNFNANLELLRKLAESTEKIANQTVLTKN